MIPDDSGTTADAIESPVVRSITPPAMRPAERRLRFDEHGHAIPLTEAEKADDAEAWRKALAEMQAIPDDPPGSDEEFWRAIDEGRPDRPLFQHLYKS